MEPSTGLTRLGQNDGGQWVGVPSTRPAREVTVRDRWEGDVAIALCRSLSVGLCAGFCLAERSLQLGSARAGDGHEPD